MKISGEKRIADRYVTALFEAAQEAGTLGQVEQDTALLGEALRGNEDFRHFLVNPLVPGDHQADTMASLAAKLKLQALTRQFVAMLAHQKRLPLLPAIVTLFAERAAAARGEMTAELITASPLKAQEIRQIGEGLSKACNRKVSLDVREDPSLLGGIVIKIGSLQFDSSLTGKLQRLKIALKAA